MCNLSRKNKLYIITGTKADFSQIQKHFVTVQTTPFHDFGKNKYKKVERNDYIRYNSTLFYAIRSCFLIAEQLSRKDIPMPIRAFLQSICIL